MARFALIGAAGYIAPRHLKAIKDTGNDLVAAYDKFDSVAGYLGLKKARVRYFLSINADCLPENAVQGEKRTYRSLSIDGDEFEFSQGFTELHTESYRKILSGEGFRIAEARPCIEIVSQIRNATPIGLKGDYHPMAKLPLSNHPFGWDDHR